MSRFLSERLSALSPYTPGEQPQDTVYIKLNTNESPFPPAPGIFSLVNQAALSDLRLYSDPETKVFTEALAEKYGVSPSRVFTGNGSDMVLSVCFQAFCDRDHGVVFPDITYGFYPVLCSLYNIPYRTVPLREDFTIHPDDYADADSMIVLANPNAPTGIEMTREEIETILRAHPDRIVLVDEAYAAFGSQSAVPLLEKYENLLIVSTFSKAYNLAGARLGFALGSPEVINDLIRIKYSYDPYSINRLSLLCGTEALRDTAYFNTCIRKIIDNRTYFTGALREIGFTVLDSAANFVFARPEGKDTNRYFQYLRDHRILVRHFDNPRISDFVRITIGSRENMETVIGVSKSFMKEA
ncbi:MAG: histidinol-phosphate transaminase [Clostridia bacterium]|nr:histidinol-phosphate transaminase [Clostridia bacterium]